MRRRGKGHSSANEKHYQKQKHTVSTLKMEERPSIDPAVSEEDGDSFGSTSNGADDILDSSTRSKSSQFSLASSGRKHTDDAAENRYFGRSENRSVRNLKLLVFLLLFLVTLTVCLVIYLYTDRSQQDEFEAA